MAAGAGAGGATWAGELLPLVVVVVAAAATTQFQLVRGVSLLYAKRTTSSARWLHPYLFIYTELNEAHF